MSLEQIGREGLEGDEVNPPQRRLYSDQIWRGSQSMGREDLLKSATLPADGAGS